MDWKHSLLIASVIETSETLLCRNSGPNSNVELAVKALLS